MVTLTREFSHREIYDLGTTPWYYGLAWRDHSRRVDRYALLGLNWLLGLAYWLYYRIAWGPVRLNASLTRAFEEETYRRVKAQYDRGIDDGIRKENARWVKVFDDFLTERQEGRCLD